MEVNRDQLAEILGCSKPTIDSKIRKGMPYIQKGGRGKAYIFSVPDVVQWLQQTAVHRAVGDVTEEDTTEALKRRMLAAKVTHAEIEAAQARGEVASVEVMEQAIMTACIQLRQTMRQIPNRVSLMLIGVDDEVAIKKILLTEIDHCLETLSTTDVLRDFTADAE
ncbi:MAG: terminase small subunit [Desulfovibrio sp.]